MIRPRNLSSNMIIFTVLVALTEYSTYSLQATNINFQNILYQQDQSTSSEMLYSNPDKSIKKHVIIVTLESAPFMMKRKVNGTVEWYGYCIDFFEELIKHLPYNISYEIYQVADNKFGSKNKGTTRDSKLTGHQSATGKKIESWNGLVGDLYLGKAHLALAPLAVMAERELVIDFTVPFYDLVGIQILLKKPEVPQDWFKFLTVLDNEVWFSIAMAYFVTSFIIFLFDRLSPYSHKNLTRIRKLKEKRRTSKADYSANLVNSGINSISSNLELSNLPVRGIKEILRTDKYPTSDHLTKSHELSVGSLAHPVERKSSIFTLTGLDLSFKNRRGSIFPSGDNDSPAKRWARGSNAFGYYFKGLDFRRSNANLTTNGSDTSDIDDGKPDFSFRDSLWFCITSLTPQGGGEAPQNLSGRVVAGAWWLFCFIVLASYTANLAAFLTVSRLDIPIESLDDLAKQYKIKYAPIEGTAEKTYFERMAYIEEIFYNIWKDMSLNASLSEEERSKFAVWDYPISDKYTKIWSQIQQVGMPKDVEAGIKRVKSSSIDDGFALLADANMVKHAVMTDCSFKAVGDEFSRKPIALGLRKGNDQFRDELSHAILHLINQRFLEILREKWWTNNPNKVICNNNDESEGISVENIGGVFIIIFAGVVLSFLVWAIEFAVGLYYKSGKGHVSFY